MFPFSSITSIVPFFVLALAYFLYFSAAIITKHIPHENLTEQRENTIRSNVNSLPATSYPDYRNVDDSQSPGIITVFHSFPDKDISCIYLGTGSIPGISGPNRVSAFSPRPPPVC
jgi:hypothetical protein